MARVTDWLPGLSLPHRGAVPGRPRVLAPAPPPAPAVSLLAAAVWWARRWYSRTALAMVVLVVVAANVLAGVNAYYGYYLTLGQAVGLPGGDMAPAAGLKRRTVPAGG